MTIREHPSTDSCHQSCDLYIHYQVPTQWLWVDHPADELVQLTTSYTSVVKNMISQFIRSISSSSRTNKTEGGRVKWKFISSWLACVLSGILSGPQQILQTL